MTKDDIYSKPLSEVSDFKFDNQVANVFSNMIHRSVPGYEDTIRLIGIMAEKYVLPGTHCYDLGCSLGEASLMMQQNIPHEDVKIISVDNSEAMLEKFSPRIPKDKNPSIELKCDNIQQTDITNASFAVMNFTLQFIPLEERLSLLKKIYGGLHEKGVLIISEKIKFEKDHEDQVLTNLHHEFKKLGGYTELEISQKRTALENVLIPETLAMHRKRLSDAGFKESHIWFQCFNFVSLIAFK